MRKTVKLGLYGAVLTAMVGGTAAWATTDKAVAVTIDGQSRTIHTRAATVGGALHDAKIVVAEHDVVAPVAATQVHDGSRVVLLKGRLLHLDVDGKNLDVWTTATTVDQALADLGFGYDKSVSVSRSTRLPLSPTELTLLTPKRVTITADNRVVHLLTTKSTVGQVIVDAGLRVGTHDRVSVSVRSAPVQDEKITIHRVRYKVRSKRVSIPFSTTSRTSSSHFVGTTVILKAGRAGVKKVSYRFVYIDGKLVGKKLVRTVVLSKPITQEREVGTKKQPVSSSSGSGGSGSGGSGSGSGGSGGGSGPAPVGSAQSIARDLVSAHGWDGSQFSCLVDLWNRESGWRTNAANPSGAYGIPQALPGSKMSSAGPDWQNNATTQITWGLGYISGRYGTPCGAWAHSQSSGWY